MAEGVEKLVDNMSRRLIAFTESLEDFDIVADQLNNFNNIFKNRNLIEEDQHTKEILLQSMKNKKSLAIEQKQLEQLQHTMTKLLQENKLKNAKLEKLEAKIVTKDKTKIIERQRLEIKLCKLLSKTTFAYTEEYLGYVTGQTKTKCFYLKKDKKSPEQITNILCGHLEEVLKKDELM
ncbi:uncharacterized protein LOC109595281 isoform X2 [Aethina tumida]|nr:uncharacterized protein LOC109595281 isoform X2 [Aethina tumida]